ncbi:hypothetical protein AK812_SmicGene32471 [Symbiodinium microadriaticum]|uniref:Uncharacterized protein n=1 Tax=Symbiodinium microadriaticum TaxID=2951 RepID=A0A1Q9CTW7_SYMMI|nr:hypothetical protein AK812_SmicGene32471 [Symbiodinium microadriaticum]
MHHDRPVRQLSALLGWSHLKIDLAAVGRGDYDPEKLSFDRYMPQNAADEASARCGICKSSVLVGAQVFKRGLRDSMSKLEDLEVLGRGF